MSQERFGDRVRNLTVRPARMDCRELAGTSEYGSWQDGTVRLRPIGCAARNPRELLHASGRTTYSGSAGGSLCTTRASSVRERTWSLRYMRVR